MMLFFGQLAIAGCGVASGQCVNPVPASGVGVDEMVHVLLGIPSILCVQLWLSLTFMVHLVVGLFGAKRCRPRFAFMCSIISLVFVGCRVKRANEGRGGGGREREARK